MGEGVREEQGTERGTGGQANRLVEFKKSSVTVDPTHDGVKGCGKLALSSFRQQAMADRGQCVCRGRVGII
jgi:hypothetical protein